MRRATRPRTVAVAGVLVTLGVAPFIAAPPVAAVNASTELTVEIAMAAPCPSRIGCTHDLRVEWLGGTADLSITSDGPTHQEVRPARFQVVPGDVRISLVSRAVTLEATDVDGDMSAADGLADCELATTIEAVASATVHGVLSYAPPPPGSLRDPRFDERWSCALTDAAAAPSPTSPQGVVVPRLAGLCDLGDGGWGCRAAIDAAANVRRALSAAPLAVGAAFCPEPGACRAQTFAVSFATREGDASPWSEPYLVMVGTGMPAVLDWPSDLPVPEALLDLQARHAARVTGHLGEAVALPTHAPGACLDAAIIGRLVRHAEWGIALGDADDPLKVAWPAGWTAREGLEGLVLIDASGETVAREGELVQLDGGADGDGAWATCGDLTQPPLD